MNHRFIKNLIEIGPQVRKLTQERERQVQELITMIDNKTAASRRSTCAVARRRTCV